MEGDKKSEYEVGGTALTSIVVPVNGIEKSSMQLQLEVIMDAEETGAVVLLQFFACCQL